MVRSVDRIFRDTRNYQRVVTRFDAQRRSQSETVLARQSSATQTLDLARAERRGINHARAMCAEAKRQQTLSEAALERTRQEIAALRGGTQQSVRHPAQQQ